MEAKADSFFTSANYIKGRAMEPVVAEFLKRQGWNIIPSYDYSGDENKAPRLQGMFAQYVLPDLDVCRAGKRVWVEVKTKAKATYTRKTKRLEHGIPLRHLRDYAKVQALSGSVVWVVVYEEDSGEALCCMLDAILKNRRIYAGGKMSRGGMVFFPRDIMKHFARFA